MPLLGLRHARELLQEDDTMYKANLDLVKLMMIEASKYGQTMKSTTTATEPQISFQFGRYYNDLQTALKNLINKVQANVGVMRPTDLNQVVEKYGLLANYYRIFVNPVVMKNPIIKREVDNKLDITEGLLNELIQRAKDDNSIDGKKVRNILNYIFTNINKRIFMNDLGLIPITEQQQQAVNEDVGLDEFNTEVYTFRDLIGRINNLFRVINLYTDEEENYLDGEDELNEDIQNIKNFINAYDGTNEISFVNKLYDKLKEFMDVNNDILQEIRLDDYVKRQINTLFKNYVESMRRLEDVEDKGIDTQKAITGQAEEEAQAEQAQAEQAEDITETVGAFNRKISSQSMNKIIDDINKIPITSPNLDGLIESEIINKYNIRRLLDTPSMLSLFIDTLVRSQLNTKYIESLRRLLLPQSAQQQLPPPPPQPQVSGVITKEDIDENYRNKDGTFNTTKLRNIYTKIRGRITDDGIKRFYDLPISERQRLYQMMYDALPSRDSMDVVSGRIPDVRRVVPEQPREEIEETKIYLDGVVNRFKDNKESITDEDKASVKRYVDDGTIERLYSGDETSSQILYQINKDRIDEERARAPASAPASAPAPAPLPASASASSPESKEGEGKPKKKAQKGKKANIEKIKKLLRQLKK